MSRTVKQDSRYQLTHRPSHRTIALTATRPERQKVRLVVRSIVNDPELATEVDVPVEYHHRGVLRQV